MQRHHVLKRRLGVAIAFCAALSFGLGACSSSKKSSEGDAASEEIPDLDAGTDAVPVGELEQIEGNLEATAQATSGDGLTPPAETPAETPPADTAMTTDTAPPADPMATPPMDTSTPTETASTDTSSSWTGGGGTDSYTVQTGDTLMKIAFETYGDLYQWKKIFEWNRDKLSDPNAVPPGVSLKLEKPMSPVAIERNGEKYLIKTGDTLGTISDDIYGTKSKWKKLWENNRQMIKDPNRIFAGFYLYYTMTPEERDESDRLKQQRGAPPLADAPPVMPEPAVNAAAPEVPPAPDERSPASTGGAVGG